MQLGNTDLGRNLNHVRRGKERDRVYKDKEGSFQRDYTNCLKRAVVSADKQTYPALYMINCLCLLLGENSIF